MAKPKAMSTSTSFSVCNGTGPVENRDLVVELSRKGLQSKQLSDLVLRSAASADLTNRDT